MCITNVCVPQGCVSQGVTVPSSLLTPIKRNWNDFERIYFFLPDLIHELQREPIKPQETSDQDSDDESNSADSGFKLPRNIKYQRKYVCEVETKSPLCYTMKQLRHGLSEYRMVLLT